MAERGNKKNVYIDRFAGIPLTVPARIYRTMDRISDKQVRDKFTFAVICLGAIGDLLMCSALIQGIKKENPAAIIDLFTTKANEQVAPLLLNVRFHYSFKLSEMLKLITTLRKNRYDVLFDTTQWARVGALVSAFSDAGLTVGFKTPGQYRSLAYDVKVVHCSHCHEYENFLNLGREIYPRMSALPELRTVYANSDYPDPYVVCHMFASGSNTVEREWGEDNWKKLMSSLIDSGYTVLCSGSVGDKPSIDHFISNSGFDYGILNIAGKSGIAEFAGILMHASAMVTINTGPMHLSALLGVFTVALNGPTNPVRWGAVGKDVFNLAPANASEMLNLGFEKVPESSNCSNIPVEEVLWALKSKLKIGN